MSEAVGVLRAGGVVAYPTDTLIGLAVDPRSAVAVARLFGVKGRETGKAIPLIAADIEQVRGVAIMTPSGERLAAAFWPGPLTLVLDARPGLHEHVLAADGSVAIRIPASGIAVELARGVGHPITSTSANLSGAPPTASAHEVRAALGDRLGLVLDEDAPGGAPSTIVDARGERPRLLRAGAVAWERVLKSLQ